MAPSPPVAKPWEKCQKPLNGTNPSLNLAGPLIIVILLALVIRLVHVAVSWDVPTAQHLIGDAAGYYDWSKRIAAGEWVGTKGFYQAPLYPYALAAWHLFAGETVQSVRVLQAIWGSVACGLLCVATASWFGRRAGLLAGIMMAIYGPAIYFDGIIQKASLDNLLVCAALACIASIARSGHSECSEAPYRKSSEMLRSAQHDRNESRLPSRIIWRCVLLGALISLLCLTRENAMAWHLVLPAWIGWRASSRVTEAGGLIAAYLLGAAVVLAPVGVRNWYVQGESALTTFQAGPNFYIGNSRTADGRYQPLVRGHETPLFEQRDATELAEKAWGQAMSPREVSRYWMRQAWADIAADPIRWLKLLGYKLLLVWNRYEIADAESITVYRRHSPALNCLGAVWHFGVLVPFAVMGIVLTWSQRRHLGILYALIITMTIAVAAFYVLARYRYPLVPLLIPFAAAGARELWRRRAHPEQLLWPVLLAAVVAAAANWPIQDERKLDALAEMNAGVALAQDGNIEEAGAYFARAVAGHPASAEANYNLAMALALQGKYAEAIPFYQTALVAEPKLPGAHYNLAVAFERSRQYESARTHYERALQMDSQDSQAADALKRLRGHSGQ